MSSFIERAFDEFLKENFGAEFKGEYGEKLTARKLKFVSFLGKHGKVLQNVYVPKTNGDTSEIDLLFITTKGIFVIESKNYSGWIFGDDKSVNWTVTLPNGMKNRLYNPILQNKTHMKWLAEYIGDEIPLFSLIVFSERCELKSITISENDVKVIKRNQLKKTVDELWDSHIDVLDHVRVDEIYSTLKKLASVDESIKQRHIDQVNSKYYKKSTDKLQNENETNKENVIHKELNTQLSGENLLSATKSVIDTSIFDLSNQMTYRSLVQKQTDISGRVSSKDDESRNATAENIKICPRCSAELVLRTAKKGEKSGSQFYGCSRFPKCRYVQNI